MVLEFIVIGFVIGGLVGLTGVGGASLLTPILIFMGVQPSIAIGTDFLYNSATKVVATYQHIRQKTVKFTLVKYMAIGSLPAAIVANVLFYTFLVNYYNEELILDLLGFVLITISLITFVQIVSKKTTNRWKQKSFQEKKRVTILAGFIIGAMVGLTSVGAGSLFALFMLYFFNIKSSELVGTDITHAFLLTFITAILMAGFGNINYLLAINLLIGSIPGTIIGSKLTLNIPPNYIRICIVVIILFSGFKLIL
ncbi:sulfite exporter TauE/SafE family protein [Virgibacillus byunsanensis]|uniref:Probable membrane transporter protein n=1 Tax=Virgibacillus byunsanensis TaxID=570945 RepID=A0ABW3LLN5_9BACI